MYARQSPLPIDHPDIDVITRSVPSTHTYLSIIRTCLTRSVIRTVPAYLSCTSSENRALVLLPFGTNCSWTWNAEEEEQIVPGRETQKKKNKLFLEVERRRRRTNCSWTWNAEEEEQIVPGRETQKKKKKLFLDVERRRRTNCSWKWNAEEEEQIVLKFLCVNLRK